ncbi:MAG TPA: ATP-binding protein [Chloroflexia bacterium]|nr:ATP-binding protein [Chloroflexia bacterium]
MEVEALEALIQKGESYTVEFKVAPPRQSELAERLCGFANSKLGGMLLIGVRDKSWEIVGVKSEAAAIDTIVQASRMCKPPLPLHPNQIQVVEIRGKKLVLAHIPPNDGTLYQAGGVYWLRRGTLTSPMDTAEITNFLNRQGQLNWELQPVMEASFKEDLDMAKVQAYLDHLANITRRQPRITDFTELMLKLKCAVKVGSAGVYPTNAGLLLFGYAPRYMLTQAEIVATYYQDTSGINRFTDRKTLTGTLPEQIDQASELLRLWIPSAAHVEGFHRIDEPALPLEALREAVINAVVHRDYSQAGTAVRIFSYPDRIEIHNPGLLPGNILLEQLRHGEAPSLPRNPVIATVLKDLPGGYMERVGSGVRFMINQMLSLRLAEPEFKEQSDEFVVTFFKRKVSRGSVAEVGLGAFPVPTQSEIPLTINGAGGYANASEIRKEGSSLSRSAGEAISTTDIDLEEALLRIAPAAPTSEERRELAMRFVRAKGHITHKQYRALTGASETTAIRDLNALVASGALRKIGSGPSRRYVQ